MNNINRAQQWMQDNVELLADELASMPEVTTPFAYRLVTKACTVRVHMKWYWNRDVVGYVKNGQIYFNTRNTKSVASCVDYLVHEVLHLFGYKHDQIRWYKMNRAKVMQSLVYRLGRKAKGAYNGKNRNK